MSAAILVVDDTSHFREFLARILSAGGYSVDTVVDGAEGLDYVLKYSPQLIITDISMPRMTGIEMLDQLRRSGVETPAIVITTEDSPDLKLKLRELSVAETFLKPFDGVDLLGTVRDVLAHHSRTITDHDIAHVVAEMNNPFLLISSNGIILSANAAALPLLDNLPADESPVGQSIARLTANRTLLEVMECAASGEIYRGEVQLLEDQIYNATISEVPGVGYAVLMQDISHLKAINRAKTELIEMVSHQVRSPLTAILSYIVLMRRTGQLNENQTEFARLVRHNVTLITETLTDLLDLGKIEAGADDERGLVSLVEIANYAINALQTHAVSRMQKLHLQVDGDVPPIVGDPVRLRQVYLNLIENAIKYTPEGGKVSVSVFNEGQQVMSVVSDTGIGIPLDEQSRVFEKFYRASEVVNAYEGTGLGLSIVKSIVESYDGRVWVDSRVGEGTTFTIVFPAAE